jgi:LmbE family N-acetylglucosaminyl deacetylase
MTRGEAGLYYREPYPRSLLASVRQQELEASLACLGVAEQRFLGYPDGGLPLLAGDEVVARLHDVLVELSPDVIVTFGSDGFTGHPDHQVLSSWVTAATRLWSKSRARVLHATVPHAWQNSVVPRLNEFDFFWPGHPRTMGRPDVTFRWDDEVLAAKMDALLAHASQMAPLVDAYGEEFLRVVAATEVFRLGRLALRSDRACCSTSGAPRIARAADGRQRFASPSHRVPCERRRLAWLTTATTSSSGTFPHPTPTTTPRSSNRSASPTSPAWTSSASRTIPTSDATSIPSP